MEKNEQHTVCIQLRAKRSYGHVTSDAEPSWSSGLLATDCFWCLRTLEAWGQDDCPALPEQCVEGRSCYEGQAPAPVLWSDNRLSLEKANPDRDSVKPGNARSS